MHNQPDIATLLSTAAHVGTTIISADGIAIMNRTAGRWRSMIVREVGNEPDTGEVQRGGLAVTSSLPTWQSLLIAPSEPRNDHMPTLIWWSHRSGAFKDQAEIAELFARNAGVAIHNAGARDNLTQAVVARHRAGVAQGILMAQLRCSQEDAIAILKDRSQRTNRKLWRIADEIIRSGDLESAPTAKEREGIR
jgi:hypothetical protein